MLKPTMLTSPCFVGKLDEAFPSAVEQSLRRADIHAQVLTMNRVADARQKMSDVPRV
jgi:hypothetical protein